jgi:hypothetical protein
VAAGPEGAGGFGSCKDSGMAPQVIEPLKMDSGKAIAGRERGARLRILAILFGALGAFFIRLIRFETRQSHIDYDEAISTFVGRCSTCVRRSARSARV